MRAMRSYAVAALVVPALVAVTLLAGCSSKGKVREPAKLVSIEHPAVHPANAWTASAGNGSGKYFTELAPSLQVDAVYAADIKGRVYAYSISDGKRLWQAETKARIAGGPGVSGDLVLVGTLEGEVIALKRTDGSEAWRAPLSSEALSTPTGDGNIVVARSVDGRVFGLSAGSGSRLWTFDRTVPELVLRGMSRPLIVGPTVIVGMENGRLVSLNLADGQPRWEQAISVPSGRTVLDRLVDIDGDMVLGDECLYVASFGGEVVCLDPASGQVGWRRGVKSFNSLAAGADKVFVSDESGVIWALDAKSGAAAWKQEGLLYRHTSPPVFFGGYVVVGDFDGYLHWIDPSDGKIVGRSRAGSSPIVAQPVASDELLYVMNSDGRLAAIRLGKK